MVQSMTGFATSHSEWRINKNTVPITITIRSLNGRFFETTCRMPHILASLEQAIVQHCKAALKRGNITVTIHFGSTCALRSIVIPPADIMEQYVASLRTLKTSCKLAGEVTLEELMNLPHLFEAVEEPLPEALAAHITGQIDKLVGEVLASRQREGAALHKDLTTAMTTIRTCIEEVAPRAEIISQERRERFLADITASLETASPELKQHHVQALYQQINTIDTHEEIVRFRTHLEVFLQTLNDTDVHKGKKLDFTLQELFREINTLSAKLADAASITPVLTIKTKLEQAREQVQNIV